MGQAWPWNWKRIWLFDASAEQFGQPATFGLSTVCLVLSRINCIIHFINWRVQNNLQLSGKSLFFPLNLPMTGLTIEDVRNTNTQILIHKYIIEQIQVHNTCYSQHWTTQSQNDALGDVIKQFGALHLSWDFQYIFTVNF